MSSLWDSLVDAICRPPRDDAYTLEDLVGGASGRFSAAGRAYVRMDSVLINRRGQRLLWSLFEGRGSWSRSGSGSGRGNGSTAASSFFLPSSSASSSSSPSALPSRRPQTTHQPIVVYAHCNSGSRRDAEEVLGLLLPAGVAVAALDFAGSGLSEGEHVTLGQRESEDLEDLITHLFEAKGGSCRIAVWGRSMGAVAALLAASAEARRRASATASTSSASSSPQNDGRRISAVVLDSPFSSLPELMAELVAKQRLLPLFPKALLSSKGLLLSAMARSVKKRAGFDLRDVVPIKAVSSDSSSTSRDKSTKSAKSADGASSSEGGERGADPSFASLLPPALFGHAELDSFIAAHHSRKLHERYAGADKALCAFAGDHNTTRPASFRSAALGFLKEVLLEARTTTVTTTRATTATATATATATTTVATTTTSRVESNNSDIHRHSLLTSTASLGAAEAFDDDLGGNPTAPGHPPSFGAVASGHASDEREAWRRASATAASVAASAAASVPASEIPSFSSKAFFLPRRSSRGGGDGDDEEEEREMVQRAIAASLELSRALAEKEAREAREAALAAAGVAADAAAQLREEQEERQRRRRREADLEQQKQRQERQQQQQPRRRQQQQQQQPSSPPRAPAPAFASFDLTQEQRELHAFFSPPSPVAERALPEQREQEQEPQLQQQQQRQPPPPPKRQLRLPKAPPAVAPSSSSSCSSENLAAKQGARSVEARAGGRWKS